MPKDDLLTKIQQPIPPPKEENVKARSMSNVKEGGGDKGLKLTDNAAASKLGYFVFASYKVKISPNCVLYTVNRCCNRTMLAPIF